MSLSDEPIDDAKPIADQQEQERPEQEAPVDPEVPEPGVFDEDPIEADPADVAEQRREVPLDEERIDEEP